MKSQSNVENKESCSEESLCWGCSEILICIVVDWRENWVQWLLRNSAHVIVIGCCLEDLVSVCEGVANGIEEFRDDFWSFLNCDSELAVGDLSVVVCIS